MLNGVLYDYCGVLGRGLLHAGYSVGSVVRSLSEIREEAWHVPGFQVLTWLVPHHIHIPQVYYLLLALLLGQPVKNVQNNTKVSTTH